MKMPASIWLFRSCDWHCCAGGQMERDEGWGRYGSIHLACLTFRRVCVSRSWMHCFGWCQFLTFFCLAVSGFMVFTWWMIKQMEESHGLKSVQRSQTFGLLSKLWWKPKVDRQMKLVETLHQSSVCKRWETSGSSHDLHHRLCDVLRLASERLLLITRLRVFRHHLMKKHVCSRMLMSLMMNRFSADIYDELCCWMFVKFLNVIEKQTWKTLWFQVNILKHPEIVYISVLVYLF